MIFPLKYPKRDNFKFVKRPSKSMNPEFLKIYFGHWLYLMTGFIYIYLKEKV